MNQDLITIVTVTYNAEDLLEETILSVINQTYKNIEYIIIDGASTDGTGDIIKKYEKKIDYWVSEPDEGIYYAMNKAIAIASGKWINFMNAGDTFYDFDTLKEVMSQQKEKDELIYGDFKYDDSTEIIKAKNKSEWFKQMPFCHQTLFTRTDIIKQIPFDTNFKIAADHDFIMKMYLDDRNFHYINHTIAIFGRGGFAENNTLHMYIESLNIFFKYNIPIETIKQSTWYLGLQWDLSERDRKEAEMHRQNADRFWIEAKQCKELLETPPYIICQKIIQPLKKLKKFIKKVIK